MQRVTVTHATTYRYDRAVDLGPHRMMLRPRETRDLRLVAFRMEVTPATPIMWTYDVSGNAVASANFTKPTDMLSVQTTATIDLGASAWPVFPVAASAIRYPFRYPDDDWIDLGALAALQYDDALGRLVDWARGFVMATPTDTLSLLKDISNGVTATVAYQARETEGTQGPLETLDRGWGSCRDFAVLFAEAVRALGLGARIVSGYIYDPENDLVGSAAAGSTHAWVEVFVPGAGWIAFDPTNRAVGSANLIPVAVARNIRQVSPVSGSFSGPDANLLSLDVAVTVSQGVAAGP
jgi:transglutaminase-like putative cysteine protease